MNNRMSKRVFSLALAMTLLISLSFSSAFAEQSQGTITSLSANYSFQSGNITIEGLAGGLSKNVVVLEVLTPSGSLLYFGTAAANEQGFFSSVVQLGALSSGTYKVRGADYSGGAYTVTEFVVVRSGFSSGSGSSSGSPTPTPSPSPSPTVTSSDGSVKSSMDISGTLDGDGKGVIQITESHIDDSLNSALEAGQSGGGFITMEINGTFNTQLNSAEINLPKSALDKIVQNSVDELILSTSVATFTFNSDVLGGLTGSSGQELKISSSIADKEELSNENKELIGDRPVYRFSVTSGEDNISTFNGFVGVSVPYTPAPGEDPNAIVIYYINAEGNLEVVSNCKYDAETGRVSFKTNHFSDFAVGYNKVTFSDIPVGSWYQKGVDFIAARKITAGTGSNCYSPGNRITRGESIVLLMRAYNLKPDLFSQDNFADAGSNYYTGYLAKVKQLGIAHMVEGNRFEPDREITRQELFTLAYGILKNTEKLPGVSEEVLSDFKDSGEIKAWAREAMAYFVKHAGISGNGEYLLPDNHATRAQMAQIIYNLLSR